MFKRAAFLGSVFFCLAGNHPVSATTFPLEIQNCISSAVCSNPVLVQQAPTFSAYSYSDGATAKFLFEYGLWPSSNQTTNFGATQFSGAAWLSANAEYDLTQERHFFNLYLDGVTPSPDNLWFGDSDGLDVGLSMSTDDLLAGSSFFHMLLDDGVSLEGDLVTHGDMGPIQDGQSFSFCLADGCEVGARLNLLNMLYLQSGSTAELVIDATDPRGILYSQYQDWAEDDTWYLSQSYEVVPVPPAIWLFGSTLGLLGWTRRKTE